MGMKFYEIEVKLLNFENGVKLCQQLEALRNTLGASIWDKDTDCLKKGCSACSHDTSYSYQ